MPSPRCDRRLHGLGAAWGGGTSIGANLARFAGRYESTLGAGDTVTIVVSDGFDTGEPDQLVRALRRIRRRSALVVWINPHAADPRYRPEARGMLAALPYVDRLVAANDARAFGRLVDGPALSVARRVGPVALQVDCSRSPSPTRPETPPGSTTSTADSNSTIRPMSTADQPGEESGHEQLRRRVLDAEQEREREHDHAAEDQREVQYGVEAIRGVEEALAAGDAEMVEILEDDLARHRLAHGVRDTIALPPHVREGLEGAETQIARARVLQPAFEHRPLDCRAPGRRSPRARGGICVLSGSERSRRARTAPRRRARLAVRVALRAVERRPGRDDDEAEYDGVEHAHDRHQEACDVVMCDQDAGRNVASEDGVQQDRYGRRDEGKC